jgi:hypothetical protein
MLTLICYIAASVSDVLIEKHHLSPPQNKHSAGQQTDPSRLGILPSPKHTPTGELVGAAEGAAVGDSVVLRSAASAVVGTCVAEAADLRAPELTRANSADAHDISNATSSTFIVSSGCVCAHQTELTQSLHKLSTHF